MKVAITDSTFGSLDIEEAILRQTGCALAIGQCKTSETLIELVRDADAVITQFAPVKSDVVAAMQRARVIVRYGIGVDNVDLEAARERKIPVCNVPDYCIDEVADHTLAFILAATRQVVPNTLHVRDGKWGLAGPLAGMRTLRDQVVGIVGFGRIGREVALRLAPFKCRRLVHDPVVDAHTIVAAGCEPVELATLLDSSDLITLHCPSTPQTHRLLNAKTIASLKHGAIVVNLARGDLIETSALVKALQSGHLAGAPRARCLRSRTDPRRQSLAADEERRRRLYVASTSVKAVRTLRETAAGIAVLALAGKPLPNIVNGGSA